MGAENQPTKPMNPTEKKATNPYRIPAATVLRWEGVNPNCDDSVLEFLQRANFDATAPACCSEGCVVEPDGRCPHGCPSVLIVLGVI